MKIDLVALTQFMDSHGVDQGGIDSARQAILVLKWWLKHGKDQCAIDPHTVMETEDIIASLQADFGVEDEE